MANARVSIVRVLVALVASGSLLGAGFVAGADSERQPKCYEDEIIVWSGEQHSKCVNIGHFVRNEMIVNGVPLDTANDVIPY